jgi:hypothetical protein
MKLSEHFSLIEFTRSQTASRHGINNTPNEEQLENLKTLAKGLEDVRTKLDNNPINISSGFRCQDLNDCLGSKRTSRHLFGLAADFTCDRYDDVTSVFSVLADSSIGFDQLILEYDSWIHIAFPKKGDEPQRQVLIINKEGVHFYG